jgi:hypothetical protein
VGVTAVSVGGLAASAIGAGVSAVGAISSANATSANANYQAQVAKNNSIIASQNAEYATQAGQEKAQETSIRDKAQLGAVTTAIAANGLDVDTGSSVDVQQTQRETGTLATQQVVDAAALQAYGYRTNATSFTAQSGLDTAEAGQATTAGDFAAGGSLLSGASGVGLNFAKLSNAGVFGSGGGFSTLPDFQNPELGGAAPAGGLT